MFSFRNGVSDAVSAFRNAVSGSGFYIMPLPNCDVLLGISWHYDHKVVIDTFAKTITISHRGKTKTFKVSSKAESVPIVSASAISMNLIQARTSRMYLRRVCKV